MNDIDIYIPEDVDDEDVAIIELLLANVPEITMLSDRGIEALADVLFQINSPEEDNQFE